VREQLAAVQDSRVHRYGTRLRSLLQGLGAPVRRARWILRRR
jgi:hypothetical protein